MLRNDLGEVKGVHLKSGYVYCRRCLETDERWAWKKAKPDEYLYENDIKKKLYICDSCKRGSYLWE
jgi:hypothetical protein